MNRMTAISVTANIVLIIVIILIVNNNNNFTQKQEQMHEQTRFKVMQTLAYANNYARKIEDISKIADLSHADIRKAYDNAHGERVSRQLALDSVYVIKEWLDRAKKDTETWPRENRNDIDKAFRVE